MENDGEIHYQSALLNVELHSYAAQIIGKTNFVLVGLIYSSFRMICNQSNHIILNCSFHEVLVTRCNLEFEIW